MNFELTILGSSAALPTVYSITQTQILEVNHQPYLIDCGEGTQTEILKNNIKIGKIEHIFISHLHGDHFYGLFGLLGSYSLNGRRKPLNIYGPPELESILSTVNRGEKESAYPYPIIFHQLQSERKECILYNKELSVFSFPLKHGIPTTGFLFQETPKTRKIRKEKIEEYKIPVSARRKIIEGADFYFGESLILNEELTLAPKPSRSFAYCCDTSFDLSLGEYFTEVDLLLHDASFCDDLLEEAGKRGHSTAKQAAELAVHTKAKKLVLGHFSTRYKDKTIFIQEARMVFSETYLGLPEKKFEVC